MIRWIAINKARSLLGITPRWRNLPIARAWEAIAELDLVYGVAVMECGLY